eukprot:469890_1
MSYKCIVGDIVTFKYNQYEGIGTVRFVGSLLPIKTGLWVGIERNSIDSNEPHPEGFNGKVADMQYFQCKKNRGIIVPYEHVEVKKTETETEATSNSKQSNAKPTEPNTVEAKTDTTVSKSDSNSEQDSKSFKKSNIKTTKRKKQEAVDAKELAQKFKRSVKTKGDKTISKLKQKQSDITFKIMKHSNELRKKEMRQTLAATQQKPMSVSNRTAELLQQQKLLSQTVSMGRKQFMTEQVRAKENIEIKFNDEQLKAIDIMADIFKTQTKQPLNAVVDDIQELQTRQEKVLANISKSAIWFNKEERKRLNEMSTVMNKVPHYRKKLSSMKQKVQDIQNKVDKLKRDTNLLKNKIGIKQY